MYTLTKEKNTVRELLYQLIKRFKENQIINPYKNLSLQDVQNKLKFLDKGSSRKVYKIDDSMVLKAPYTEKGREQSACEVYIYRHSNEKQKQFLCNIFGYYGDSIFMEKVKPIHYLSKFARHKYEKLILDYTTKRNTYEYKVIISLVKDFSLELSDLKNIQNWGITKEGRLVILDYGLTHANWLEYYQNKKR